MSFILVTDVTCDLPKDYCERRNLIVTPMPFSLDNVPCPDDIDTEEFYRRVREGAVPSTSQIAPAQFLECFETLLQQHNQDILYIGISSALSGTVQSANIAAQDLRQKYPGRLITIVDSKSAALGQGLLVSLALDLRDQGMDCAETARRVQEQIPHCCAYFTVDDLNHLYRGGRLSKVSAMMGTLLSIKPLLHISEQGKLVSIGKTRGRKQSLAWLVERMEAKVIRPVGRVLIGHGDCPEDAKLVAGMIEEKFGVTVEIIDYVGVVVGSHSGPGTVALFFWGTDQSEETAKS